MIPYHKPLPIEVDFSDIIRGGQLSNDHYVATLENEISRLYHKKYVIACSSCTQGIIIALTSTYAEHINIPAFTWFSIQEAMDILKIHPDFKDIDYNTWLMNNLSCHAPISLVNHTFGSIHNSRLNKVIYDASHALGAKIKDFGLATVFSLAPTKMITSCEGGIIITEYPGLYARMKEVRDKVSRMSEFNAKYGLENLKHLNDVLDWKKKVYEYYKANLSGTFQSIPDNSTFNTIGVLTSQKIPSDIETRQYYVPLIRGLRNTDLVYEKMVCLPSWFGVDYKLIVDKINEVNQ